jgi:hypothetical protein
MRVLQRSKSIHKIVHNISLRYKVLRSLLLLFNLLTQRRRRRTSLHRHERSTARFKPRCDPPQRLALPPLLLFLPCAEVRLVAFGLCCDRCAAVGLDVEYVRFERERVDELEWEAWRTCVNQARIYLWCCRNERAYVCVYVLWERVDVRWEFYLVKTP